MMALPSNEGVYTQFRTDPLIDPERQTAEFYQLHDGRYRLSETPDDTYASAMLPGLKLPLAWLSRSQQPNFVDAMRFMGIL